MPLPLDDGYLRRECPLCERQFKWHNGPTDARPPDALDPDVYFCPYCGESAPPDHWWTTEQLDVVQKIGVGELTREVNNMFRDLERETRNGAISFNAGDGGEVEAPDLLHEPSDMVIVAPPCHSWEPIKVDETWREDLHCLLCGEPFVA